MPRAVEIGSDETGSPDPVPPGMGPQLLITLQCLRQGLRLPLRLPPDYATTHKESGSEVVQLGLRPS